MDDHTQLQEERDNTEYHARDQVGLQVHIIYYAYLFVHWSASPISQWCSSSDGPLKRDQSDMLKEENSRIAKPLLLYSCMIL